MARIFEDDRQDFVEGLAAISEDCVESGESPREFFGKVADDHFIMLTGYMMGKTGYSLKDCVLVIDKLLTINPDEIWAEVEKEVYGLGEAPLH